MLYTLYRFCCKEAKAKRRLLKEKKNTLEDSTGKNYVVGKMMS